VWNPLAHYRFWNQLKTCIWQFKEVHPILSCRLQILHGTLLGFTFSYMQKTGGTPQLKLYQHSEPNCLQKVVVLWKAKKLESCCFTWILCIIHLYKHQQPGLCIYLIMLLFCLKVLHNKASDATTILIPWCHIWLKSVNPWEEPA